jgi:putative transposase
VFEQYARCDQALVLAMLEMVVNGVSTRKVSKIVEQLCGQKVSKSFVSTLTEKLDPIVNQWASRPLNTMYYPYIFADAMYIKVREHNRVVSKAVYIATAVDQNNRREILGLRVDHGDSTEAWQRFFQYLKSRGLQSPKLRKYKNEFIEQFVDNPKLEKAIEVFRRRLRRCHSTSK